jgi:tetratricopeptide (TPR) repeat protein
MQETLLEELSTTRRVRLHGEVAEALENRWGAAAMDNASRLARHYAESATLTPAHAEKAVLYLDAAARQSEASFAWDDAAEACERILQLNGDTGNKGDRRAEGLLLASLGRCLAAARHFGKAWGAFRRALDIFDQLGASGDYARAVAAAVAMPFVAWPPASEVQPMITHALEGAPADELEVRGRLLLASLDLAYFDADQTTFDALAGELQPIIATGHVPYLEAAFAIIDGSQYLMVANEETRRGAVARVLAGVHALEEAGLFGEAAARFYTPNASILFAGPLDEADDLLHNQAEDGRRAGLSLYVVDAESKRACIRLLRGGSAITGGERIEGNWPMDIYRSYERLMRTGDPSPLPDLALGTAKPPWAAAHVLVHRIEFRGLTGDLDGAVKDAKALDGLLPQVIPLTAPWVRLARAYLGIRWLGESIPDARAYALPDFYAGARFIWALVNARMYGELALAVGDFELAESSLQDGLDWCIRERCPVEEGRVRQALAELAEKRGDHTAAVEQLDRAGELFQQFGAKLFLDQVLAKKEILKA